MKIYYFGELVEDTNKTEQTAQMSLDFDHVEAEDTAHSEPERKTGMPSLGDLLQDLDLSLDVYRPLQRVLQ